MISTNHQMIIAQTSWLSNSRPSTGPVVIADHDLFWDDPSNGPMGALPVFGDPRFVDRAALDYRIRPPSRGIDAGLNSGVDLDVLGVLHPQGRGLDIGAYERVRPPNRQHLPLVVHEWRKPLRRMRTLRR
jgi:hypothetical protein